jgi:DNA primase large subunit
LLRPLLLGHNVPMSKQELRKQRAALSFSENIKILEKLRERSLALAAVGLRRKPATNTLVEELDLALKHIQSHK